MGAVVRPSQRVAANRRRAAWLLVALAGVLVSLAGGPMITVFNSLDLLGLVLMVAGLLGLAREVDR